MSVKKIHPTLQGLAESGFTLLEVLITLIVLAIGLLGLASLQSKIQLGQVESYQRTQAVLLLDDMVNRIQANRGNAAAYVTVNPLGTGDVVQPASCAGLTVGLARDQCEWNLALNGAAEKSSSDANVGAMVGARGCVQQVQAPNPAGGVCTPGIYRVTVAWQGLTATSEPAPALDCGAGLYGADGMRRAISAQFVIGLPTCT